MKNKTTHLIECKNVSLSYDGNCVLENANFYVDRGDYLCIVGENGSGKSTLVKALLSLKKVSQGEIIFASDVGCKKIGYLPQRTNVQKDFPATVREVVLSGCLGTSLSPIWSLSDKLKADRNMERLGIGDIAGRCFRDLSGGQQQRALLARALCAAGSILLLDEPTAGLDPIVTKEMYRILEELNREEGMTIIMVSHDFDAAMRYATKILHLERSVKFFGARDEYMESDVFGRWGNDRGL